MKKIFFPLLIFSFLIGCKSENKNFDENYFNGYWLTKLDRENYKYPNFHHFQDSIANIFLVDIGYYPYKRFQVFTNDSIGISWNFGDEDEFFTKSKFTIINRNTFLASSKKYNYTDSLFRVSKEEAEKIRKEWKGTIEVEPPRTK